MYSDSGGIDYGYGHGYGGDFGNGRYFGEAGLNSPSTSSGGTTHLSSVSVVARSTEAVQRFELRVAAEMLDSGVSLTPSVAPPSSGTDDDLYDDGDGGSAGAGGA